MATAGRVSAAPVARTVSTAPGVPAEETRRALMSKVVTRSCQATTALPEASMATLGLDSRREELAMVTVFWKLPPAEKRASLMSLPTWKAITNRPSSVRATLEANSLAFVEDATGKSLYSSLREAAKGWACTARSWDVRSPAARESSMNETTKPPLWSMATLESNSFLMELATTMLPPRWEPSAAKRWALMSLSVAEK